MRRALYLFVSSLLIFGAGCGEDEKPTPRCSADCNGQLIANPDGLCVLENAALYEAGVVTCDYNETTKACEINTSACIQQQGPQTTEVGPKEYCDGANLVCSQGYTCTAVNGGSVQMCLQDCSSDPNGCPEGDYCDTESFVFDAPAVCWTIVERNNSCLAGAEAAEGACTGDNVECVPTGNGFGNACFLQCSGATVDQQGIAAGCAEDEWCLADQSGYISGLEFQVDANGDYVQCPEQDNSLCNGDEKYRCHSVNSNDHPEEVCARSAGRCGTKIPLQMDLSEAALGLDEGTLETENFCNARGTSQFCEGFSETEGVSARVECEQLNWGYNLTNENNESYSCTQDIDCGMLGAECINWTNGSSCGFLGAICVAYCESWDGSESFTCPSGLTCAAPETMQDYILEKDADDEDIQCTTDSDCSAGNVCHEFSNGSFCLRYRKVCTDAANNP